jgi:hypothetical protein
MKEIWTEKKAHNQTIKICRNESGQIHRDDGPAIIKFGPTQAELFWFKNGVNFNHNKASSIKATKTGGATHISVNFTDENGNLSSDNIARARFITSGNVSTYINKTHSSYIRVDIQLHYMKGGLYRQDLDFNSIHASMKQSSNPEDSGFTEINMYSYRGPYRQYHKYMHLRKMHNNFSHRNACTHKSIRMENNKLVATNKTYLLGEDDSVMESCVYRAAAFINAFIYNNGKLHNKKGCAIFRSSYNGISDKKYFLNEKFKTEAQWFQESDVENKVLSLYGLF